MKILLVEDNIGDAELFRAQLKDEHDVDICTVTTLTGAIDSCAVGDFDLVALDLSLPDSDGLDTLHTLHSSTANVPAVVILTGLDDGELALKAVKAGAQDFLVKGALGWATLFQTLRHAVERHRMSQELMAANDRVRYLATHCPLTDLPNRFLFLDRLHVSIETARRGASRLAVFFLDLDGFKPINDSYGHGVGDAVLRVVASRLKESVRKSDTVARLGGDEFTFLLRNVDDLAGVRCVVDKITTILMDPIEVDGRSVMTQASIGIAIFPDDGDNAETVLKNADAAMYQAKRAGIGVQFFSEALSEESGAE